jgi:hypothetical protein
VHQRGDSTSTSEGAHQAAGREAVGPRVLEVSAAADAVVAGGAISGANDYKKVIDAMRAVLSHSLPEVSRLVTALPPRARERGGPGRASPRLPDSRILNPADSHRS